MDFNTVPMRIAIVALFLVTCFLAGWVLMSPPPANTAAKEAAVTAGAGANGGAAAPATGPQGVFVLNAPVRIEMIAISPGTFMMGTPPEEKSREPDEVQHEVTLTRLYYLGKTEVTQLQWTRIMGDNPSAALGDDLPVESVTFAQVQQYCRMLSAVTGKHFRLPTEAEWEYACRAGTTDPYQGKTLDEIAWANHPALSAPHAVATRAPNAWGLYDMLGNVWELCSDYYADYPPGPAIDPMGPPSGTNHVNRGGSFQDDATMGTAAANVPWRSGNRASASPTGSPKRGFRLAMDAE